MTGRPPRPSGSVNSNLFPVLAPRRPERVGASDSYVFPPTLEQPRPMLPQTRYSEMGKTSFTSVEPTTSDRPISLYPGKSTPSRSDRRRRLPAPDAVESAPLAHLAGPRSIHLLRIGGRLGAAPWPFLVSGPRATIELMISRPILVSTLAALALVFALLMPLLQPRAAMGEEDVGHMSPHCPACTLPSPCSIPCSSVVGREADYGGSLAIAVQVGAPATQLHDSVASSLPTPPPRSILAFR